jgi:hypothetical protein
MATPELSMIFANGKGLHFLKSMESGEHEKIDLTLLMTASHSEDCSTLWMECIHIWPDFCQQKPIQQQISCSSATDQQGGRTDIERGFGALIKFLGFEPSNQLSSI